MRRTLAGVLLLGLSWTAVQAQPISRIGTFIDPWGGASVSGDITADGQWLVFAEKKGSGCSGVTFERLSMIRTDGTDYRVIIDWPEMELLEPDFETLIENLVISGDGRWAAFKWPHKFSPVSVCSVVLPMHWYLVDLITGDVSEITFNGQVVSGVSFTNDGETMAFMGYDPSISDWDYFLSAPSANPTPETSRALGLASPLTMWPGKLSGDGSKFVFVQSVNTGCCPANVYVHDVASGATIAVNPMPEQSGVSIVDISDDGQRVMYGSNSWWAVDSDATGLHAFMSGGGDLIMSGRLTRSGSHLVYSHKLPTPRTVRVPWVGGPVTSVPFLAAGVFLGTIPASADGSIIAGWDYNQVVSSGWAALVIWFDKPRVLTTYGHGTAGSTLTWDVGGAVGDSYLLAWSLLPGARSFKHYGTLGLDVASLQLLGAGVVSGADNVGKLTITIPESTVIPSPLPVHFQALVLSGPGVGGLTNTTAFTLQPGVAALSPASGGDAGAPPAVGPHPHAAPIPASMSTSSVDPAPAIGQPPWMSRAEWERYLLAQDPSYWMAEQRAGREVVLPSLRRP